MKIKGARMSGKSYLEEVKCYKKIAIHMVGWLGWILATPKTKAILISSAQDFIDDLVNVIDSKENGTKEND